ncbi:hypothetical protein SDC9_116134 [bioreactor metagenome]|uniref:Uncharacterized protein n=1 Tax=bioreactor metagenome TaxID=1076179 RepID=A0A645BUR8_9ZZZZ
MHRVNNDIPLNEYTIGCARNSRVLTVLIVRSLLTTPLSTRNCSADPRMVFSPWNINRAKLRLILVRLSFTKMGKREPVNTWRFLFPIVTKDIYSCFMVKTWSAFSKDWMPSSVTSGVSLLNCGLITQKPSLPTLFVVVAGLSRRSSNVSVNTIVSKRSL